MCTGIVSDHGGFALAGGLQAYRPMRAYPVAMRVSRSLSAA